MLKLVLPKEGYKWSFLNGYYVFNSDVTLVDEDDVKKYKLIDEDGNVLDVPLEDYLEKY